MTPSLKESIDSLGVHAHAAHLARRSRDRAAAAVPFLAAGHARGERGLLFATPAFAEEVLEGLRRAGVDVGAARVHGSLIVLHDAGRSRGREAADPAGFAAILDEAARLARSERFPALRIVVEIPSLLGKRAPRDALADHVGRLGAFVGRHDALALCVYPLPELPPDAALDALAHHPQLVWEERLFANLWYDGERAEGREAAPARTLERRLARLAELQRETAAASRQAARLRRFRDVSAALLVHGDVPSLLRGVTEGVMALGYRMCWIGLARPDGSVEPAAAWGDRLGYLKEVSVRWDDTPAGNGPVGRAIRTGRTDVIRDVTRSRRFAPWRQSALARGFRSVAAIPLREGERIAGALAVYAGEEEAFDREAIEELDAFALRASLLLSRALDLKRAAEAEERFRRLFEQIPAACFTYDRDGIVRHWNLEAQGLYGFPAEEAVGRSLHGLLARPQDRERTEAAMASVFRGESLRGIEWEDRTAAGEPRWVLTNTYPFRGAGEAVELGISVNIDVTSMVMARRALAASEERFRTVFTDSNVVMVEMDPEGRILLFNRAAEALTGYAADEVAGKEFFSLFVPARDREPVLARHRAVLAGAEERGTLSAIVTRGGDERTLNWSVKALGGEGPAVRRIVAVGVDVTDRLRAEEERERLRERSFQSTKMEAIGALAGGIAHDFNNLLGGILGYATLLESRCPAGDPAGETAGKIRAAAERAADLTSKLLGYARRGKHRVESLSLNDVAAGVAAIVSRTFERSIAVRADLSPDAPRVDGDAGQLEQALLNLCLNARDAMPAGGNLAIATSRAVLAPEEAARLHAGAGGVHALLVVRDTGEGISDEAKGHLFEPFYTTRRDRGRSGMGLAMVYGIVKNHGGAIHVESAPGRGTAVRIWLPASAAGERPAAGPAAPVRAEGAVLVVDDEPAIRDVAKEMLSALGFRTLLAGDGEEACRLFRERRDEIGLVLLDVVMPRMGGREAFAALRAIDPAVRVLVTSGYAVEGLARAILDAGADGFLQKPFGISDLDRAVRGLLRPGGGG